MKAKNVVKRLKPKGKRINEAVKRLGRRADASYSANAGTVMNAPYKLEMMRRADAAGRLKAEQDLGYMPGEKIGGRSTSGVDRYSGSAYRIGKGAPQYPTYPIAEESKIRNDVYAANKQRERSSDRGYGPTAKREIKSKLATMQRANPRKSVKGKAVKGAIGAASIALIVSQVLKELNKK